MTMAPWGTGNSVFLLRLLLGEVVVDRLAARGDEAQGLQMDLCGCEERDVRGVPEAPNKPQHRIASTNQHPKQHPISVGTKWSMAHGVWYTAKVCAKKRSKNVVEVATLA